MPRVYVAGISAFQFNGSASQGKSSKRYLALLHVVIAGGDQQGWRGFPLPACFLILLPLNTSGYRPLHLRVCEVFIVCLKQGAARPVKPSVEDLEGAGGAEIVRWCLDWRRQVEGRGLFFLPSCSPTPSLAPTPRPDRPGPLEVTHRWSLCSYPRPHGFGIWVVPCMELILLWQ